MPDLKLFFFRTLLDRMLVLRNHSIYSVSDLIDLCNPSDWLCGPQLYTHSIHGWLYSLAIIKLHYLSNKEKACYICNCINQPSVFTFHNHSTKSCDTAPLRHAWKSCNTNSFNQLGITNFLRQCSKHCLHYHESRLPHPQSHLWNSNQQHIA